ncbi:TonB-dependent receptor [Helicobacter fennelliae]
MKNLMKKSLILSLLTSIALAQTSQDATDYDTTSQSATSQSYMLDKVTAKARGFDSKLDELNRNVYIIDKSTIENKGFKTTEEIFDYIPFTGKANVGLGTNIDLRGQGAASNVNVQVLLNGTQMNMLDSSHGVTPINTISPSDIERIEILPGGGAVMYGNGTRGGVINIITKKRYESFSPNVGISYKGTPSSKIFGSEVNTDARFGGKIGENLYYSISGRYLYKYGYRVGDETNAGNIGGNLTWDINDANSLSFDVSYFHGIINTSPNLLMEVSRTGAMMSPAVSNAPSQSKQYDAGLGNIKTQQDRIDAVITYDTKLTENQKLQIKALYHFFRNKYLTNRQDLYYSRGWVTDFSQDGSYFLDTKVGAQARYDLTHNGGRGLFIAGVDSIYSIGERLMNMAYRLNMTGQSIGHDFHIPLTANKWTNSIYAIEKYNFTDRFSLTGGARYENANYTGKREYSGIGYGTMVCTNNGNTSPCAILRPDKDISANISNFALEITPKFDFGSSNVYAKYERGFRSPNPDNLTMAQSTSEKNGITRYVDTNVKSEYYHTFEIGSKAQLGRYVFVSGAVFYTLTENELYSYGSAHTEVFSIGNYGLTSRAGVEVFVEEAFFERSLRFNQSFTYIDARILDGSRNGTNMDGRRIPYVSNIKATLGINWDIGKHFSLWTQNSLTGAQRDVANKELDPYILTDLGLDSRFGDFTFTIGARNLFDATYFTYYNSDPSDKITGYSYLYAPGIQFFTDLRYAF